jgi:hypothetical protein
MWLFKKSGIRNQELRSASALRRAFDEAGNRKTITRADRQLLGWSEAKYLTAVNPHGQPKSHVIADILRQYEEQGHAMRHLDSNGRIAWKATPLMLSVLAERDAVDDLADVC